MEERKLRAKLKPGYVGRRLVDLTSDLYLLFDSILDTLRARYSANDRVCLYIEADNFNKNLVIHLREIKDMTADTIMGRLAKIIQSDEGITLSESFRIHVGVQQVEDMRGTNSQGRFFHKLDPNNDFNCVFRKKCVVRMKNTDNL